ncbi:MAG: hypothetical protein LAO20_16810 [Acidobacteriia bacterium]|nr:hypothetical protein [Terriglobia bacterium]
MSADFVNVRLTPFGAQQAGEGTLRVTGGGGPGDSGSGHHDFIFKAGEAQRVTRAYDWERVLRHQHSNGHLLFEIVPDGEADPAETRHANQLREDGADAESTPTAIEIEIPDVDEGDGK